MYSIYKNRYILIEISPYAKLSDTGDREYEKDSRFFPASFFIIAAMQQTALAFAPPWLSVKVIHAPSDLEYLDILVPKNLPEIHLDTLNQKVIDDYPDLKNSKLIGLESDGYVSYTLYFDNAYSDLVIRADHDEHDYAGGQLKLINTLKIAALNDKGELLKISDAISITPDYFHRSGVPTIIYDYSDNSTHISFEKIGFSDVLIGVLALLIVVIFADLIMILVKLLAALLFKLKQILQVVVIYNVIAQPLVIIIVPLLTVLLPFFHAFILSAMVALVAEFIIMTKNEVSKKVIQLHFWIIPDNNLAPAVPGHKVMAEPILLRHFQCLSTPTHQQPSAETLRISLRLS